MKNFYLLYNPSLELPLIKIKTRYRRITPGTFLFANLYPVLNISD